MACHALWCGVPVITLAGQPHASRMVASVLSGLGLHEWIARDEDGYVDAVVERAEDLDALQRLRASLRARMAESSVTDGSTFARQFESGLLEAWEALKA